ncbi:MAG: fumarylacetoacetate hydrolase family protein [Myxococcales bacterium]|nr:fumarylacetoacetate hydrolase family protein [Myxococcales bacterium]MDH3482995.1 fumarylacetoacetate hydrolase family protein [Myxococcales bacterium]
MARIASILFIGGVVLVVGVGAFAYYLFRPLSAEPTPADFQCYDFGQGAHVPLDRPPHAFGIGLSYAAHIQETASEFDAEARPPVFEKHLRALSRTGANIRMPNANDLIRAADEIEPGLGATLRADYPELSPLLDYEVEMGFVLLEDVDPSQLDQPSFAPRLGFFIANDLSARSVGILGEGQPNRYAYWGLSKSFPGFMPIADQAWVPAEAKATGIPCIEIESIVNGEVRQRQSTANLIYTPVQMLRFIHAEFPDVPLQKGLIVLTGTPGGVAMATPRWLVRLSNLLGLSRFRKLSTKLNGDTSRFLHIHDRVDVRGQELGEVSITIVR